MMWITALLVLIMLSSAIAVLLVKSHVAAIAAASAVSLALSILFVILQAPDVAMTEAVVGSGLSTVILALTLHRIGRSRKTENSDA